MTLVVGTWGCGQTLVLGSPLNVATTLIRCSLVGSVTLEVRTTSLIVASLVVSSTLIIHCSLEIRIPLKGRIPLEVSITLKIRASCGVVGGSGGLVIA